MAALLQHLAGLVRDQVNSNGIVVWYDPEECYAELLGELDLPDTTVEVCGDSFYELRYRVDELLSQQTPPRLLVYVPMEQSETHHALAELETAGVVMQPRQQPPSRNTRLAVVARNAAREQAGWNDEHAERLASDIEDGKYSSVAEIEDILERGGPDWGALRLVFGTDDTEEVALKFLCREETDDQIEQKELRQDLYSLLNEEFGTDFAPDDDLTEVRCELANHVLATDFLDSLSGDLPEELERLKAAEKGPARRACVSLAGNWRSLQGLQESYRKYADRLDRQLSLGALSFSAEHLGEVETFRSTEEWLQKCVEQELAESPRRELLEIAEKRRRSFWSRAVGLIQARWALAEAAGRVLQRATEVESATRNAPKSTWGFVEGYTGGEEPWYLLDRAHRHMEARAHDFEFDLGGRHKSLEKLLTRARRRYMEVAGYLAEEFQKRREEDGFGLDDILSQNEVYGELVRPQLGEVKTAYVLVDALRYEMAEELVTGLGEAFSHELQAALGTLPGITSIGMAALMPKGEGESEITVASNGKLGLRIGDRVLQTRQDRIEWLEDQAGVETYSAHLRDLFPTPARRVRKGIEDADLVVVTSQEIDEVCEGGNVGLARTMMGQLLRKLSRGLRILAGLGVERIVIAADHGYLFLDELSSDMKVDPPGGETIELHRRVWVGRGGATGDGFVRTSLAALGMRSDMDVAVPRGFACFKVAGGGKAYFHGGVSLPESVIPVAVLKAARVRPTGAESEVQWSLRLGSDQITTRFLSVQIGGTKTGLLDVAAPRVNLELRCEGKGISRAVSASYGFQEGTGEVQLRWQQEGRELEKNTVSLTLPETPSGEQDEQKTAVDTASLHLLDAETGRELKRLDDIPVDLAL